MADPICGIYDIDGTSIPVRGSIPFGHILLPIDFVIYSHSISLNGGNNFISTYIDMDQLHPDYEPTPDSLFGTVSDIISVSNEAGDVWYKDATLHSTLTTLVNEAYIVNRKVRAKPFVLQISGAKLYTNGSFGDTISVPPGTSWLPVPVNNSVDIFRSTTVAQRLAITRIEDSMGRYYDPLDGRSTLGLLTPGSAYYITANISFQWTILAAGLSASPIAPPTNSNDVINDIGEPGMTVTFGKNVFGRLLDSVVKPLVILEKYKEIIDVFRVEPAIYAMLITKGYEFSHQVLMGFDEAYINDPLYARQDYIDHFDNAYVAELAASVRYKISFRNKYNKEIGGSYTFPHVANLWNKDVVFKIPPVAPEFLLTVESEGVSFKYQATNRGIKQGQPISTSYIRYDNGTDFMVIDLKQQ